MSVCSLSKKEIKIPVISLKTGHVFDKETIEEHIKKTGQCPITGKSLSISDIKNINAIKYIDSISNNDLTAPSFTEVISLITSEYNNIEEEIVFKKQELIALEKDLTEYSFRQEAARLVISRLVKEKEDLTDKIDFFMNLIEEAKTKHDRLTKQYDDQVKENKVKGTYEDIELIGMHEELVKRIKDKYNELFQSRKNRKTPSTLLSFSTLSSSLKVKQVVSIEDMLESKHKSNKSNNKTNKIKSICAKNIEDNILIVIVIENSNDVVITQSSDIKKCVHWSPSNTRKNIKSLSFFELINEKSAHSIGVSICSYSDVSFYKISLSNLLSNESSDVSLNEETSVEILYQYKLQDSFVISSFQHPTLDYALVVSDNYYWSVHNIISGVQINNIRIGDDDKINHDEQYTSVSALHPDGIYLAVGDSTGKIYIISITTEKVLNLIDAHSSTVVNLMFSENGYNLASSSKDNTVKIWDLRKTEISVKPIKLPEDYKIISMKYDLFGNYLGISDTDLRVYHTKSTKTFSEEAQVIDLKSVSSNKTKDSNSSTNNNNNFITGIIKDFYFGKDCKEVFVVKDTSLIHLSI